MYRGYIPLQGPLSFSDYQNTRPPFSFFSFLIFLSVINNIWLVINHRVEDEMVNPLPLQIEPMPLARDTLCAFPSVGSILRVIVRQGNDKLGLQFLIVGRWVRFINMICEVRWGLWCGVLMPFSRLRFLSNEDRLIIDRQRYLSKFIYFLSCDKQYFQCVYSADCSYSYQVL